MPAILSWGRRAQVVLRKLRWEHGVGLVVVAVLLAAAGWSLRPQSVESLESFWQYVLNDFVTRAAVRLLVVALSIYGIVSIPVLVFRGRWIRSAGPAGVAVDDPALPTSAAVELARAVESLSVDVKRLLERERNG